MIRKIYNYFTGNTEDQIGDLPFNLDDLEFAQPLNAMENENNVVVSQINLDFMEACKANDIDLVRELLKEEDLNINAKNANGDSPIILACKYSNLEIVRELINFHCIDANIVDKKGNTPLIIACKNNNLDIIEELLQNKETKTSIKNENEEYALLISCENNNLDAVSTLLQYKDSIPDGSNNLIDMLFENGGNNTEIIEMLISAGVELTQHSTDEIIAKSDKTFLASLMINSNTDTKVFERVKRLDPKLNKESEKIYHSKHIKSARSTFDIKNEDVKNEDVDLSGDVNIEFEA